GVVGALAATAALVIGGPAAASTGAADGDDVHVIVVLGARNDIALEAQNIAEENGGRVGQVYDHVLGGFEFTGPAHAIAGLSHRPGVRAVVAEQTFKLADVGSYGFFRIGADKSVNDAQGP